MTFNAEMIGFLSVWAMIAIHGALWIIFSGGRRGD